MATSADLDDFGSTSGESEISEVPELISDGKRMRKVWKPGDGDGESSAHLVERSMNLVKGHPTWKIFMGEVTLPIVRGSDEEPPHYVYLDDRACYAIYCSKAYDNEELRRFYPWDFNHQGNIKQGRLNRGNPAYLDDSNTVFAQARLRAKGQWYTFTGEPEVTEYKPRRPKTNSRVQEEVTKENAETVAHGVDSDITFGTTTKRGRNTATSHLSGSGYQMSDNTKESTISSATARKRTTLSSQPEQTYVLKPKRLPPRSHAGSPYSYTTPGKLVSSSPYINSPIKSRGLGKPSSKPSDTEANLVGFGADDVGGLLPSKRRFPGSVEPATPRKRAQRSPPTVPLVHCGFSEDEADDEGD
jgi:hypothetical protein